MAFVPAQKRAHRADHVPKYLRTLLSRISFLMLKKCRSLCLVNERKLMPRPMMHRRTHSTSANRNNYYRCEETRCAKLLHYQRIDSMDLAPCATQQSTGRAAHSRPRATSVRQLLICPISAAPPSNLSAIFASKNERIVAISPGPLGCTLGLGLLPQPRSWTRRPTNLFHHRPLGHSIPAALRLHSRSVGKARSVSRGPLGSGQKAH